MRAEGGRTRGSWTGAVIAVAGALTACGPSVASSGGNEGGTSSTSTTITETDGDASSGSDNEFCDGEPLDELSWCHEPADFDVSPMAVSRIFGHVAVGPSGATALILHGTGGPQDPEVFWPEIYQEFVLTGEAPGFRLEGFGVEASVGSTDQITPVRVFADGEGRHDYLPQSLRRTCTGTRSLPSPEREAEHRPTGPGFGGGAVHYGFDRCRSTLFSPIALAGTAVDSFFYYCEGDEYCLSIDPDPPADGWLPSRTGMPAVQTLPAPSCAEYLRGPDAIVVGQFDGSASESLVVLRHPCEDEIVADLQTVVDAGDGRVAWGPSLELGEFAGEARTLRVFDFDQDGADDLLLLGAQRIGIMFGSQDGLTEPQPLPVTPVSLPYFETENPAGGDLEEWYPPNLRVGAAQFDSTPELEVVVRVDGGVRVMSLDGERSVLLDELATDFALADVDADGIDDLALIYEDGDRVRIYRSSAP